MSKQWPARSGEGRESARRMFARALVEYERVRVSRAETVMPDAALWGPLHELAMFHGMGPRRAALSGFCAEHADTATVPESVPRAAYRGALRVAVRLAGDALVRAGVKTPWGRGKERVPKSTVAFKRMARVLRDDDESGAVARILDDAECEREAEPMGPPRVVFDVPGRLLVLGGVRIALPEGREYRFLRTLATRRKGSELTPTEEHGVRWKPAADHLRRRIRKATGQNLLRFVVLPATAPVGGYRLAPDVEVVGDREVKLQTFTDTALESMEQRSHRKPRGRDLRGEHDDA